MKKLINFETVINDTFAALATSYTVAGFVANLLPFLRSFQSNEQSYDVLSLIQASNTGRSFVVVGASLKKKP